MYYPSGLSALVLALLYTLIHSLPVLPITNALPNLLITNTTSSNAASFECFSSSWSGSRRADTNDCLKATMALSRNVDRSTFHRGGPVDPFRLPTSQCYGTCCVSIDSDADDESTWTSISLVATQVTSACSRGYFPIGNTGGYTVDGNFGHIRVTVGKANAVGLVVP